MSFSLIQLRLLGGNFPDVEFARREHHLADRTVKLVAIDVDIRKVVVSPDGLDLTQGILQRTPIPQPDVRKSRLVAGPLQSLHSGVRGKCLRPYSIERVSPTRHADVVRDEGALARQLVRGDDEVVDVPLHAGNDHVAGDGGNGRGEQPYRARSRHRDHPSDGRTEQQRRADHERAAQSDVGVRVSDPRKNRAVLK